MKTGFKSVKTGFKSVKTGFKSVKNGFKSVKNGFKSVKNGFKSVKNGFKSVAKHHLVDGSHLPPQTAPFPMYISFGVAPLHCHTVRSTSI